MRTLRKAVLLFAVIACGCKEDDDDEEQMFFDSSVLPSFEAGVDAGRPDAGGAPEAGAFDAAPQADAGMPQVDSGTMAQDATVPVDAAPGDAGPGDASLDGGATDGGPGGDASPSDAGDDAAADDAGLDAGPGDAGRDAAVDARVDAGPPATFSRVLTILRSNCGTCHTTRSDAQLNFNVSAADVHDDLIGVRASNLGECSGDGEPERIRVIPDDPDNSLLLQKLVDPPCGDRMPRFRDALSPALIDEIRSWIADGAPQN